MRFFLAILVIFLIIGVNYSQSVVNDSAESDFSGINLRSEAEVGLKIFYSSTEGEDVMLERYGLKPLEFKLKYREVLSQFSKEVVESYVKGEFDFGSIETYFPVRIDELIFEKEARDLQNNQQVFVTTRSYNGPCVNMDFEEGSMNGWEMYEGYTNSSPAQMVSANQIGTPGAQHTLMNPGVDPVVGIPTTNPNGGAFSLRLGDGTGVGARAASIRQTFLVDASNAVFTYSYAVVLEDPGSTHTLGEKPFFKVNLYDENGTIIPCGEYQVVADGNLGNGWQSQGSVRYKDWSTVFAPLDAFIGQNVTIEFISGDCDQSGHYGYAYVDAECSPLEIIPPGTVICGNDPVTLSAPAGADSYSWNTGATTQDYSTATAGTYSVDVIPVTGASCAVTLTATVVTQDETPIADFLAIPEEVCLGENIDFSDQSTTTQGGSVDYWDYSFGDGSVNASQADPSHVYATIGTYDVQLIAGILNGQGGCYDTVVKTVTVHEAPVAAFTPNDACEGMSNQFTDASTIGTGSITGWEWDFTSNGTIDNTQQNPSAIIGSAAEYTATLVVISDANCKDTAQTSYFVDPNPVANYSWDNVCDGDQMNFDNLSTVVTGSISNYQWDFGDFVGSSNQESTSYTYTTFGQYNVVLTITTDNGCIDSETHQVEVYQNPTVSFTSSNECDGFPIPFSDNTDIHGAGSATYSWDFEGDGSVDFSGQSNDYIYPTSGTYYPVLTVETNVGCTDSYSGEVTVFPTPVAAFTGQDVCTDFSVDFTNSSSVSSGSIVSQFWEYGNGNTSTQLEPSEIFVSEGIYNVYLQVTTDQGCVDDTYNQVEIYPTPIAQFITADVCDGTTATFTDFSSVSNSYTTNSISSWSWDFGTNPATGSQLQYASHLYDGPGTYTVTLDVETNHACTDSYQYDVVIYPNPEVTFGSPNPTGCTEWCPIFTNTSTISSGVNNSYYWNLGDGTVSTDEFPVHCYTNAGLTDLSFDVELTVTSDFGCTTTLLENDFITVYPEPVAAFSFDPIEGNIYNPEINFINESLIADFNDWNFASLGTSTDESPSFIFPDQDSGVYEVCLNVETIHGCVDDTCHNITIKGYANIYVPNTFTPDGDGLNDFFMPSLYGFSEDDYSMMIFDRWGLLVYSTSAHEGAWDGTYQGGLCVEDTYVWKITAIDKYTGEKVSHMGHINLLR